MPTSGADGEPGAGPPADAPGASARRLMVIGAGALLLGGAVVWRQFRRRGEGGAVPPLSGVTVVDDAAPLPEFRLPSTRGELTRTTLSGHWTVLFFGYTQCPDVCPTTLAAMAEVQRGLGASERPQVVFVSVDAARDTLALLGQYVPSFDAAFIGAHGDDAALAGLVRHLGVSYQRQPPSASGSYTVDHTAAMFLIDPEVRLKAVFSHPPDPALVLAAYRRLTR